MPRSPPPPPPWRQILDTPGKHHTVKTLHTSRENTLPQALKMGPRAHLWLASGSGSPKRQVGQGRGGEALKRASVDLLCRTNVALDHVANLRTTFTASKWCLWKTVHPQGACQHQYANYPISFIHTPPTCITVPKCTDTYTAFKKIFTVWQVRPCTNTPIWTQV